MDIIGNDICYDNRPPVLTLNRTHYVSFQRLKLVQGNGGYMDSMDLKFKGLGV
jgi:hypothetical protein